MEDTSSAQFVPLKGKGNGYPYPVYIPPVGTQTHLDEEDDNLNLRQLWTVIKHRLPLVVAVSLVITAAVGLWTFSQKPRYEGKFELLIEPATDETQVNQLILQGTGLNEVDYETQIEVLRSPRVLEPILHQLAQKYPELNYKTLVQKHQNIENPLKINQLKKTKILEVSYEDENPQKVQFVLQQLANAYLHYGLEERQSELNQGIQFVNHQLPGLRKRVDTRQGQLQKFRQQFNLLNPEQQADRLSEQLVELQGSFFETQSKLNETTSLYEILQKQLGLATNRAIAASYLSESPRYQNLLNQLQAVEIELAKESVRFLETHPVIESLKEKRNKLLPLLNQEAQRVLGKNFSGEVSNSPSLASPSSLRLDLNKQLVQATNDIQVLQLRRQGLGQEIQRLKVNMKQMAVITRQYTDLQREVQVATDSLSHFLGAQEKLQIEAAQKASPWQLLSQPELPEVPIFPNPQRNLSLGVMAGLLLGLGAAFLAERLDPVFHSIDEIKESTQLPILGFIPTQKHLKTGKPLLEVNLPQLVSHGVATPEVPDFPHRSSSAYNFSSFLEAFRSLNTNIRFLGSDSGKNSLVISSAAPSEGKSTISLHLAQAAAAMGQKVLLVEADLRRPQLHQWLDLPNHQGLSNVLATGLDLEAAIQKVPQWENFSLLTAGDIPPDPTRLLASKRMQQIQEQLQKEDEFDLVIYDTPPLLGFADAKILAASTLGIILIIRMGKTDRLALKHSLDELRMSQVSMLGLAVNGVSQQSHSLFYYYDHY